MRDGRLDGTVQLTQGADAGSFGVAADLDATRLSVARVGQPQPVLNNESLKVVLRSLARADFSQLKIDQCDLTGSFLESHAKGVIVLKNGTRAERHRDAGAADGAAAFGDAKLGAPKAQWLYDAWSPAKPPTAGSAMAPANEPTLPGSPVAVSGAHRVHSAYRRPAAVPGHDRPPAEPAAVAAGIATTGPAATAARAAAGARPSGCRERARRRAQAPGPAGQVHPRHGQRRAGDQHRQRRPGHHGPHI